MNHHLFINLAHKEALMYYYVHHWIWFCTHKRIDIVPAISMDVMMVRGWKSSKLAAICTIVFLVFTLNSIPLTQSSFLNGAQVNYINDEDYNSIVFTKIFRGDKLFVFYSITTDADGNIYAVGTANSDDLPMVNALDDTFDSGEAILVKLSPSGEILISTYIGGSDSDSAYDVSITSEGNVVIVGTTFSDDFPIVNGYRDYHTSDYSCDIFLMILNSDCSEILHSTYFGGTDLDLPSKMALDSSDDIIIFGLTCSSDFPLNNAFDDSHSSGDDYDPFVFKISANGSELLYSSYVGGNGNDNAIGLALDSEDNAYLLASLDPEPMHTAITNPSGYFPLEDIILKLTPTGNPILNITIDNSANTPTAICLDTNDTLLVTGISYSQSNDSIDGFIMKLDEQGEILSSNMFGGSSYEYPMAIDTDAYGNIIVAGYTESQDFPIVFQSSTNQSMNGRSIFVYSMDPDGEQGFISTLIDTEFLYETGIDIVLGTNDRLSISGWSFVDTNAGHDYGTFVLSIDLYSRNDPAIVSHPQDITIYEDTATAEVIWSVYDFDNLSYTIYLDNESIRQAVITGPDFEEISINLPNLELGSHICKIMLDDYSGVMVSDEVQIDVIPRLSNESAILIAAPVILATLIILVAYLKMKK